MAEDWQHTILVVDGDKRTLSVIENFLVNAGFEVTTAGSSAVADNLLQASEYDLVLVDDQFADLTSASFLGHLQRFRKAALVVVMENRPSRPCGVRPLNSLRASRFVNKWRPCEILETLREILAMPPVPKASPYS